VGGQNAQRNTAIGQKKVAVFAERSGEEPLSLLPGGNMTAAQTWTSREIDVLGENRDPRITWKKLGGTFLGEGPGKMGKRRPTSKKNKGSAAEGKDRQRAK